MDIIDKFGEMIDNLLEENEVKMLITLPEGTLEPEIRSTFTEPGGPAIDFYILLLALEKVVADLTSQEGPLDPEKKEQMLDAILELVKKDIMEDKDSE